VTRLAQTAVAEEVLAQACAGDETARAALYAALASPTLTLIRRMVGQRCLAEDIFQDTMMIFFERLPQYRREAPLGAWLRQIAIALAAGAGVPGSRRSALHRCRGARDARLSRGGH
jgi:DNA-directed RNA polymerase specialized sigma24 family protein